MKSLQAYEAALKSAAYFYQPDAGFLRLSGPDRIDFLQRQTTNDLRPLDTDRDLIDSLDLAYCTYFGCFSGDG